MANPVQQLTPAVQPIASLLADIDDPATELSSAEIAATVADGPLVLSGQPHRSRATIDGRAMMLVRDYLTEHAREQTAAWILETITGLDRFAIARQFRRAFGTSPDRYRTLRRLGLARAAIETGQPLACVAAETGFSDQSHMTRHFKRTYGVTPARWMALTAVSERDSGGRHARRAGRQRAGSRGGVGRERPEDLRRRYVVQHDFEAEAAAQLL